MNELEQQHDQLRTGAISLAGVAVVVAIVFLVAVAWIFVVPAAAPLHLPTAASPLEHDLYERAAGGDHAHAVGRQRLEQYRWLDRDRGLVRIPIERAIDAVVADPSLIGGDLSGVAPQVRR